MAYDLIIRRARLRGREDLVDVGIGDGVVQQIDVAEMTGDVARSGAQIIDAGGNLVTESFVNPHLHLDKVYTLEMQDSAALEAYHGGAVGGALPAFAPGARAELRRGGAGGGGRRQRRAGNRQR